MRRDVIGMDKITVIPYLSFDGCCEEAINAYIKAFGGEVYYLSRWAEETCGGVPEKIGKVMHVEFALGSTRMSAGDSFDQAGGSTSIRLMIHMQTKDQALQAIAVLAEGGQVVSPLKPHPKPDDSGCGSVIKDRFGYMWIITCPNPDRE